MKMYFKNLIFALAGALAMTACSNEMEEQLAGGNGGQEVKFTVGIENLSRTTIADGTLKTEFVKGDEIGIFAYNGESVVSSNIKYTYNGSGWTSDAAIAAQDGVQLNYYAYYPYSESVTDPSAINVTVNSDQATNGFSKDDVLTAQNTTAEAGATSVSLTFAHAMAMVQVSLMQGTTDDADATVYLQSILPDTKVNAKDGSVETAPGEAVAVAMKKSAESLTYRAVVPEQTITAGAKLLTIVAGGKTFDVTFSEKVKYEKGKLLQIKVEALNGLPEGATVTISGEAIDGWIPGEEPEGGETEEVPLIQKIGTELPEVVTDTKEFTEESWFKLVQGNTERDKAEFEIVDDSSTDWGKAIKLTYDGTKDAETNNSWYRATIGYHHTEPMYVKDTYIYKVTAKIKADACDDSGTTKSKLSFTCKSKDYETTNRNRYSFAMGTTPTACTVTLLGKTPAEVGTWETYTFYIDFSKVSSTINSSPTLVDATEKDYNGFDLRIYTDNKGKKPVIYISDVTMEPYQE